MWTRIEPFYHRRDPEHSSASPGRQMEGSSPETSPNDAEKYTQS